MGARVFADTSALVALVHRRDQAHQRALSLGQRHVREGGSFVSTMFVLAELHRHVLHRRGPNEARFAVTGLLADRAYHWREVTEGLVRTAVVAWLERFDDQRFSLTDAVSFEVMRREGLTTAFAFDRDFVTAGFRLLR